MNDRSGKGAKRVRPESDDESISGDSVLRGLDEKIEPDADDYVAPITASEAFSKSKSAKDATDTKRLPGSQKQVKKRAKKSGVHDRDNDSVLSSWVVKVKPETRPVIDEEPDRPQPLNIDFIIEQYEKCGGFPDRIKDPKRALHAIMLWLAANASNKNLWHHLMDTNKDPHLSKKGGLYWANILNYYWHGGTKGTEAAQFARELHASRVKKAKLRGGHAKSSDAAKDINAMEERLRRLFKNDSYQAVGAAFLIKLAEANWGEDLALLDISLFKLAKDVLNDQWEIWCQPLSLPKEIRGEGRYINSIEGSYTRAERVKYDAGFKDRERYHLDESEEILQLEEGPSVDAPNDENVKPANVEVIGLGSEEEIKKRIRGFNAKKCKEEKDLNDSKVSSLENDLTRLNQMHSEKNAEMLRRLEYEQLYTLKETQLKEEQLSAKRLSDALNGDELKASRLTDEVSECVADSLEMNLEEDKIKAKVALIYKKFLAKADQEKTLKDKQAKDPTVGSGKEARVDIENPKSIMEPEPGREEQKLEDQEPKEKAVVTLGGLPMYSQEQISDMTSNEIREFLKDLGDSDDDDDDWTGNPADVEDSILSDNND